MYFKCLISRIPIHISFWYCIWFGNLTRVSWRCQDISSQLPHTSPHSPNHWYHIQGYKINSFWMEPCSIVWRPIDQEVVLHRKRNCVVRTWRVIVWCLQRLVLLLRAVPIPTHIPNQLWDHCGKEHFPWNRWCVFFLLFQKIKSEQGNGFKGSWIHRFIDSYIHRFIDS